MLKKTRHVASVVDPRATKTRNDIRLYDIHVLDPHESTLEDNNARGKEQENNKEERTKRTRFSVIIDLISKVLITCLRRVASVPLGAVNVYAYALPVPPRTTFGVYCMSFERNIASVPP